MVTSRRLCFQLVSAIANVSTVIKFAGTGPSEPRTDRCCEESVCISRS